MSATTAETTFISDQQLAGYGSLVPVEQSLTFHRVSYEVPVGLLHCGRRGPSHKVILDSCSGIMRSGLNAVMGPTGSGKTTLLDVLADRKGRSGRSGVVLINGQRRPKNFKCISGYVVQDDLIMGCLSVRENLTFSAALRLPSHTTRQQRRERVEKVINELGLPSCADTKVGDEFFQGVSGGERKRTSIGLELIIEPQVLFLDEPTTGLDAYTAVSVVKLLKRLSQTVEKRLIIMSIHQPRYSIFSLFTSLTLLSQGHLVYHGKAQQVLPYFHSLGFPCGEHENPADFILDILTASEKNSIVNGEVGTMETDYQAVKLLAEEEEKEGEEEGEGVKAVNMAESYLQTDMYRVTEQQLQKVELREREDRRENGGPKALTYARNILWQGVLVTCRATVSMVREPLALCLQMIVTVIFALIAGVIYFDLGNKEATVGSLQNLIIDRIGAFFFVIMNQVFANMCGVDLFIRRKALFIHENASGYYRVSVFFFSQVITDLIAKQIIPVLLFSVITYFMLGLQREPAKFFIYLLTLFMVSVTAATVTYSFSSIAKIPAVAILLSALIFVLSMLYGGFFITLDSVPVWLRWLKYLSLFRYGMEALAINDLHGQQFFAKNMNISICIQPLCINGTQAIEGRGYESSIEWIWYDQIALVFLSLIFLTICYINLQLIKKHK